MARKEALKALDKVVDTSGRCAVESGEDRCWFPGSISNGGPWICRLHFGCPPEIVIPVIEESKRWYKASRNGGPVPEKYRCYDGREVPGFKAKQVSRTIGLVAKPVAGND